MEKLRNEIEDKHKWSIDDIYSSVDDFNKDYSEVLRMLERILEMKDTFLVNADNFYDLFKLNDLIDIYLSKLYTFSHMNLDVDLDNESAQVLLSRVENLFTTYQMNTAFVEPMLLTLKKEELDSFYKENKKLDEYRIAIDEIYRYKDHVLSEKEEKVLASLSKSLNQSDMLHSVLTDSDFDHGMIKNKDNEELSLTESNYSLYLKSKDRILRKNAFKGLYKSYGQFSNTIASIYGNYVDTKVSIAKIRKYPDSLTMSLFNDLVSKEVYINLIDTVKKNLSSLHDYYAFKKEQSKLDDYSIYDTYLSTVEKNDKEYSFDEAKELVLESVKVLGDDYCNIAKNAFDEGWIDVYPNKGKVSGAYSSGSHVTKPYILLNYTKTLSDVSTLAHELGHSMHSYYSRKHNPNATSSYAIFVAEVASTVNELLLSHLLLQKATTKEERQTILNDLLELFKATIFRQTMFAEFEYIVHNQVESDIPITKDSLSEVYLNLVTDYFGTHVIIDKDIQYEWARIPHFYHNFYVYKYATGLSAACMIVDNILSGKENAKEDYLRFLTSGSTLPPLELLKLVGVDMEQPQVIELAISKFKETLEELKKECK